ncbi:MAG: hypothetical protein PGN25_05265 [Methylorubrum populi]
MSARLIERPVIGVNVMVLRDGRIVALALQLRFWRGSDSMRHHDSCIMDAGGLD